MNYLCLLPLLWCGGFKYVCSLYLCVVACLAEVFICFFALCTRQTPTTMWLTTCGGCTSRCMSVICFPKMETGKDLDQCWTATSFLFPPLALIPLACKCDCNLCTVFRFRFTTSPSFAEQKQGFKAEGSVGPRQTKLFSAPLNWCQIFWPKCFRTWWCVTEVTHYILSLYKIQCWNEKPIWGLCIETIVCMRVCLCAWDCMWAFSQVSVPCCGVSK